MFSDKPVLIVYGTRVGSDPARGNGLADLATKALFGDTEGPRSDAHHGAFERKADVDVTAEDIQNKNLLLIGTVSQNSLVAQLESQLPVTFLPNGIKIKGVSYTGTDVRWYVIYPNPLNSERYVMLANEDAFVNGILPTSYFYQNDYLIFRPSSPTSPYYTILRKGLFTQSWQ
jgi:hypothetical protein